MINAPPVITGTAKVGTTLSATTGTWVPQATNTYQWFKYKTLSDTPVSAGTASTYLIKPADLGYTFIVKVTGTKTGYKQGEIISSAKKVVAGALVKTPVPKTTGLYKVGSTLKAVPGTWDSGTTFGYQWLRDGVAITKATASTYKIPAKDKAHKISVKVTGKKTGFTTVTKVSLATKVG